MCKYCQNTDRGLLNTTVDYSDIEIMLMPKIKLLRVRAVFDDNKIFEIQDAVPIKFCPVCGRKLEDK